ncbi:MAG: DUF4249 domain-containing protein [Lentimicrobiaceae bacterium]|nr:DUF4249 domain-containing protein [Lentimicrobiaceae bacterium]
MNHKQSLLVFLLVAVVVTTISCTKLVSEEFEFYKKTPVLNCLLINDSTINVNLSFSEKPDSTELSSIDNAIISIYIDGELKESINHSDQGTYSFNQIVEPLKSYSIEALIPGFDTLKSKCIVPQQYKILDIEHSNFSYMTEDGMICPGMKVTFENDPNQALYFEIRIKLFTKYNGDEYAPLIGERDYIIENEGLPIALFSNELMDKDVHTIMLNYFTMSVSGNKCEVFPFTVELRTVNYEYYQFARRLYMYNESLNNNDMSGVIIPVQVYSNIENGLGLFAGYSSFVTDTVYP